MSFILFSITRGLCELRFLTRIHIDDNFASAKGSNVSDSAADEPLMHSAVTSAMKALISLSDPQEFALRPVINS